MPLALHSAEPHFLFLWNHKVASSSLLQGLQSEFPDLRLYPQPSFRPFRDDASWPRFLVVRNPHARVVSCFRNKCQDAQEALGRNGTLEPCQRHLLKAMGEWPCNAAEGARRLAALPFSRFVELLPTVRDGNSHFRLQIDTLQDAGTPTSRMSWMGRRVRTTLHLGQTHYLSPEFLRGAPSRARDRALLSQAQQQSVHWLRLEELDQEWPKVEDTLGKRIFLPWRVRTNEGEGWREFYDSALWESVSKLYWADREMFGYRGDSP
jgi:hypothetical protein